jgi:hypothetical protein
VREGKGGVDGTGMMAEEVGRLRVFARAVLVVVWGLGFRVLFWGGRVLRRLAGLNSASLRSASPSTSDDSGTPLSSMPSRSRLESSDGIVGFLDAMRALLRVVMLI